VTSAFIKIEQKIKKNIKVNKNDFTNAKINDYERDLLIHQSQNQNLLFDDVVMSPVPVIVLNV